MKQIINFVEFVTVVQTGSFSKAALTLGVSKSHVSKKITQLEQSLGIQLIHRSTRKLVLTEIGKIYHQRCKKIMDDILDAQAIIQESQSIPQGTLNISLPATLGEQFIVPLLSEFMQQHSQLTINVEISTRVVDIVNEGLDMVIRLGHLPDSNLMARKLGETRWIVCASSKYLDQYGTPQTPDELIQHRCLVFSLYGLNEEMSWKFFQAGKLTSYRVNPVFVSNNGAALHAAGIKGVGLIYLPEFFVAKDLGNNKLHHILPSCFQDMPISAVYPHSHHLSPKVRFCIDFLTKSLC